MSYKITRGVSQSLYKYLPDSWIDFPVRGDMRNNYIAHVIRWNSEKLDGINKMRLIRVVNQAVRSFDSKAENETGRGLSGFGEELTTENCDVLCPKHNSEERGIVAEISPLTFYCPECHKVHQFSSSDKYISNRHCKKDHKELKQMRSIYFCKCGFATPDQPVYCNNCHSKDFITWSGTLDDYYFYCTKCKRRIPMVQKCKVCGESLTPKSALDQSQYFAYSINLIDIIDENVETFISETEHGMFLTIASWLGEITGDELDTVIKNGINTDPELIEAKYQELYEMYVGMMGEELAAAAARATVDKQFGGKYSTIATEMKSRLVTTTDSLRKISEQLLEYMFVRKLEDHSTLEDAIGISHLLNTSANPEEYIKIAKSRGITSAMVCGEIPFITCSYGYTRVKSEPESGVVLHAFKEEAAGKKNIYASKLKTEGVLFEFDRVKILKWLDVNGFIDHDTLPNLDDENDVMLWFINNIRPELIEPFSELDPAYGPTYYVYNLIHTLSHLLIRSAAAMCGLDKNSISEYILPAVPATLIYCQNSQGLSLGALFNLFEAYFDKWLDKAYTDAQRCIFDPICIERRKACSGCLFLNEVSCQHFNHDLDRALIIGHVDRRSGKKTYGFWEE